MKALIFNSGVGSRLGELTRHNPKCMVHLESGETIFERQLRLLYLCGIREFVVTTGPWPRLIEAAVAPYQERGCVFHFVNNDRYSETNYIYSMHLAAPLLRGGDALVLHGDLVFDLAYVERMLADARNCLAAVNPDEPLPDKDFKARIVDGKIAEVSVSIFDEDCVTFQPMYKLSAEAMDYWLDAVNVFVEHGKTKCYAENAANALAFTAMRVEAFSYAGHLVAEVDTPEDLSRVSVEARAADFAWQPVFLADGDWSLCDANSAVAFIQSDSGGADRTLLDGEPTLLGLMGSLGMRRPLVVSRGAFNRSGLDEVLSLAGVPIVTFDKFSSNPKAEEALAAADTFRAGDCDSLLSVGGGSAIDVAKCAKVALAAGPNATQDTFQKAPSFSPVPHLCVPTTAGTGSESTHFAVVYVDGAKLSVTHECLLPEAAILRPELLASLPDVQRSATYLDALCQAIESYWSVRSSIDSRQYAKSAIKLLAKNREGYFAGDGESAKAVMLGANSAGKAINLTTTTAAHAMSYGLTSLYGLPHGLAVAACMPHVWQLLLESDDQVVQKALKEIAILLSEDGNAKPADGLRKFNELVAQLRLPEKFCPCNTDDANILTASVNVQRLNNFPIIVSETVLRKMFWMVLLDMSG